MTNPERLASPARPDPAQLAEWLADAPKAIRLAVSTTTWAAFNRGSLALAKARPAILRLIDSTASRLSAVSAWLASNLKSGRATLAGWFDGFADTLGPALFGAAMTLAGTADLPPADIKAANQQVERQYAYLAAFRDDIRKGRQALWVTSPVRPGLAAGLALAGGIRNAPPVVAPTLLSRSEMYASAAWSVAENVRRERKQRDGYLEERAFLGDSRPCSDCIARAALGYQPIGTLAPIGSSKCRSRCHCIFLFR